MRNLYLAGHYKNAFKACTGLLKPAAGDTTSRISVQKAVNHINSELLSSPGDKKLTKSTIHDAIGRGLFGVSPLKNGRPQIVPPQVTHGVACHAVMMQSSGEGEASSLKTLKTGMKRQRNFL